MNKRLIEEFKKTRKLSLGKYDWFTHNLRENTKVYKEEDYDKIERKLGRAHVGIFESDSVSIVLNEAYTPIPRRAILNFADGYTPGGMVLQGETTQEECLCRSSNLYESLIIQKCKEEFYDYNYQNFGDGKSSDRIIYSPLVAFFRDSELNEIKFDFEKHLCDVITSPAPIAGTATDEEVLHRMENIIKVAVDNDVIQLILGAWGCGAFGNDLNKFKELWRQAIDNVHGIDHIAFALLKKPEHFWR